MLQCISTPPGRIGRSKVHRTLAPRSTRLLANLVGMRSTLPILISRNYVSTNEHYSPPHVVAFPSVIVRLELLQIGRSMWGLTFLSPHCDILMPSGGRVGR